MNNMIVFGTEDLDEVQKVWEDRSWYRVKGRIKRRFYGSNIDCMSVYEQDCRDILESIFENC